MNSGNKSRYIMISAEAHDLFQDYRQALMRLAAAHTPEDVSLAYDILCAENSRIYRYIAALENALEIPRTVRAKFIE